jgi:hypothetical protein
VPIGIRKGGNKLIAEFRVVTPDYHAKGGVRTGYGDFMALIVVD